MFIRTSTTVSGWCSARADAVSPCPPAQAHGLGTGATDFRSEITTVPGYGDLQWTILCGDEFLELRHDGPVEIVVGGYAGEPYLRIVPDGVHENVRSPAAYLTRYPGNVTLPDGVEALASPEWVRRSEDPSWAWMDHRIHWTGENMPDVMRAGRSLSSCGTCGRFPSSEPARRRW